jgi:hypothetical protein
MPFGLTIGTERATAFQVRIDRYRDDLIAENPVGNSKPFRMNCAIVDTAWMLVSRSHNDNAMAKKDAEYYV